MSEKALEKAVNPYNQELRSPSLDAGGFRGTNSIKTGFW